MSHSIVSSLTSLLNYLSYSYWYKIHVHNVSYIIYIIIQKPFNIHISFFRQRSFSFSILFFVIMYFSFIIAYHTFMIDFIMFITAMFEKLYLVQASTPCDCCPQPLLVFSDVVVISPSVLLPSAEWQVIQCANIKVFLTFSIFKGCSTLVFTFFLLLRFYHRRKQSYIYIHLKLTLNLLHWSECTPCTPRTHLFCRAVMELFTTTILINSSVFQYCWLYTIYIIL